jgi:nucleoside-diphosphate-sugar epimerase
MRIFITGADGFIGGAVASALIAAVLGPLDDADLLPAAPTRKACAWCRCARPRAPPCRCGQRNPSTDFPLMKWWRR